MLTLSDFRQKTLVTLGCQKILQSAKILQTPPRLRLVRCVKKVDDLCANLQSTRTLYTWRLAGTSVLVPARTLSPFAFI